MRLERIFTHRIIRVLQIVLPALVIALIAVPGWNYYARRVQQNVSRELPTKLPSGVSVRTEGFTYSRSEGGRTQFTVQARQSLGFKDEKYMLQDVNVTIYGAEAGDPTRNISGANCTYDQATNDIACNGNVEMELDDSTLVRTENVLYNHREGTVVAPNRATIEKEGTTGYADGFEYGMNTGLLKLNSNVKIQTSNKIEIQAGTAFFHQKENWTTMSGGLFIQSPDGWIRGLTGRTSLDPVTLRPKTITVEGDVTAASEAQAREQWKLRAGWLEARVSATGAAEFVQTRGDVEIEKMSNGTQQRLSGDEIDAKMNDGKIDVLEARQNARMALGTDQTLEASQIWTTATGSVRTSDVSVLKVGDSTIRGSEFVVENKDEIVTFSTQRRAALKKDGGLESSSDQTRARFDSATNMLIELVQTGNFEFRTPQYNGRAQTGRFEEGGTVITLEGRPVVNNAERRLEASRIRVNQNDNSFVATNNVSTLIKDPKEPVLIKSARAEGGSDSMLYTGDVQLWRGDAYIKAEQLNAFGEGRQKGRLRAQGKPGSNVQSNLQNIRVTSDTLDYDDASGVIRYLGDVRSQKQDMLLETPDMTVHFRDNNVTEIVASGGVVVTRADQRGTGERAVYDAATDIVTLTGKDAQVRDERGLVQGSSLTIKNKGKFAIVEGNGGRTVTKHPVKK